MFISSIDIEGFKSFKEKFQITGFDFAINAINGPGKADILQAIYFVLGTTDVKNLREFIHENGNDGVTKAAVTITFNNSDRSKAPSGYYQPQIVFAREVVVSGHSWYKLDGVMVTKSRVTEMFSTIFMNMDKPYFIITKEMISNVLGRSRKENLTMLEAVAGSSELEVLRSGIRGKDLKLENTNIMINQGILPRMEILRNESNQCEEYQRVVKELDKRNKIRVAWKFMALIEQKKTATREYDQVKKPMSECTENIKGLKIKIEKIRKDVVELKRTLTDKGQKQRSKRRDYIQHLLNEQEHHVGSVRALELQIKNMEAIFKTKEALAKNRTYEYACVVTANPWLLSGFDSNGIPTGELAVAMSQASEDEEPLEQLIKSKAELEKGLNLNAPARLADLSEQLGKAMNAMLELEEERANVGRLLQNMEEHQFMLYADALVPINQNIEKILGSLQPGVMARISPPIGKTAAAGLEINVGLDGTWLETLDGLTDGQRSLVGLAVLLGIQLYSRAPLCILSGVDAVLDSSVIKRFRTMLQWHFRRCQVTLVPQTDGIFFNADVQLEASFVDGVATVSRAVYQGTASN